MVVALFVKQNLQKSKDLLQVFMNHDYKTGNVILVV